MYRQLRRYLVCACLALAGPALGANTVTTTELHPTSGTNPEFLDFDTWGVGASAWHIREMRVRDAWANGITGAGVVWGTSGTLGTSCAFCDLGSRSPSLSSGIDLFGELAANRWVNTAECPGGGTCFADIDGVDDDSNGWVDDFWGTIMHEDFYSAVDPNGQPATGRGDLFDPGGAQPPCDPDGTISAITPATDLVTYTGDQPGINNLLYFVDVSTTPEINNTFQTAIAPITGTDYTIGVDITAVTDGVGSYASRCANSTMREGGHDHRVVHTAAAPTTGSADGGVVGISPDIEVAAFYWDFVDEADTDNSRAIDAGYDYAETKGMDIISYVGSAGAGDTCAFNYRATADATSCANWLTGITNAFRNDPNDPTGTIWSPTPASDGTDVDFWPGCQPNQLSYLPINSDRWGTDIDGFNRSHWPAQNWTTSCNQGVAWGNWTVDARTDVSIITNRTNATAATTSWSFGSAAGILALAIEAFPTYTKAQILQRLCRTADQIDRRVDVTLNPAAPTPYDQPWPKGQILFPGASWNVNMWNNLYGCGRVNMLRFLEEPLEGGPAPMWGQGS